MRYIIYILLVSMFACMYVPLHTCMHIHLSRICMFLLLVPSIESELDSWLASGWLSCSIMH